MSNSKNITEHALDRFKKECRAEDLSLEWALAQLALYAIRMQMARKADSYQKTMSAMFGVCAEAENVIKALKSEYPDMGWDK